MGSLKSDALIENTNVLFRMIGAIAGPYGRNFSQGPIGGILGRMGIASDHVYKL